MALRVGQQLVPTQTKFTRPQSGLKHRRWREKCPVEFSLAPQRLEKGAPGEGLGPESGREILWCANIRSRSCRREIVLVMQSAKNRFDSDDVRFSATMA